MKLAAGWCGLDNNIIKNTIIHELIHCLPGCNNHGELFKKYANYICFKLGYDIQRTGNKKEDYQKSNVPYQDEEKKYKYVIKCKDCGHTYYRMRKPKVLADYRCGSCGGRLKLEDIFK